MKKILACLLAVMMLTAPLKAFAENAAIVTDAENTGTENTLDTRQLNYDYDELVVGTTMPMYGNFFTNMWGNGSSDIDVRQLIHGYNLVEWDTEKSGFVLDPSVVSGNVTTRNAVGDHTYAITLYNDLRWSDGSRITAWDYAFSLLLRMDPEIAKLGGTPEVMDYLTGYQNYYNSRRNYVNNANANAQPPVLTGVRVINDTQLNITISHNVLPFFFELALLDCTPYPIRVIAPGCEVRDTGTGVSIQGDFTAETLRATLLGEDGYISNPSVTSGPYRLVSFDGAEARFERNEYYKGDSHGALPTIQRLIFREANPDTMISELMDGEYGLINQTTGAAQIQEGMNAIAEDPRYTVSNYPRSGLSFISFNMDNPILQSADVRKAIAHSIDKDAFASEAVSNFGLRVDGYYGLGQWMYQLLNGTLAFPVEEPAAGAPAAERRDYERDVAAWEYLVEEMEKLPVYEQNPEEAVRLLVKDGWTLNREGKNFNPETDDVRCKYIGGVLTPLELKLIYAKSATVGAALEQLAEPLKAVGIGLTVQGVDELLEQYYRHQERDYDMIFLASNFDILFDPSRNFEPDGASNYFGIEDEELYELAQDMIRTEAGDLLDYCEKWMEFQQRFVEVEPVIPIYSNIYFDFYPRVLQNYHIADYSSWAQAVVPAFMNDIPEEELPMEEEENVFPG